MKKIIFTILIILAFTNIGISAETKKFNMVFVPASEKGDENDYKGLIK